MQFGFRSLLVFAFVALVFVSTATAHTVTIENSNYTSTDGSALLKINYGIGPFARNDSWVMFVLELGVTNNQSSYQGDQYCAFALNGTVLDKCNGMNVQFLPFEELNATLSNQTDGNSSDSNLTDNYSNATLVYQIGQFLITVNRTYYVPGDYAVTLSLWEMPDISTDWAYTNFTFFPTSPIDGQNNGGSSSSSGGGGGHSRTVSCITDYTCSEWSNCTDGTQTRLCNSVISSRSSCPVVPQKPIEQQACTVAPPVELLSNPLQQETTTSTSAPGLFSRITGAVVGTQGPVAMAGSWVFIAIIIAAFVLVRYKVKKIKS